MANIGSLLVLLAASVPPGQASPAESARYALKAAEELNAIFPGELRKTVASTGDAREIWQAVAPHTLLEVEINPEMRVKVAPGRARAELVVGTPRAFFVRVDNHCGATARLSLTATDLASPQAGRPEWLDVEVVDEPGCPDRLSGALVEYKLVLVRAAEPGRREARLGLDAGQGTQDLGFRGVTEILFHVRSASTRSKGN